MDNMGTKAHWDDVYGRKSAESVSWYAAHLATSLSFIRQATPDILAIIIDVGGGESTLVDDLLGTGYDNVTVLDLSHIALEATRARLGNVADRVQWLAADILECDLPVSAYDVWHDRAVFHFLTTDAQRIRYLQQILKALKPGGFAIVGTFGPEGPLHCSGLDVARYSPDELHGQFGDAFELLQSTLEIHRTPWGAPQQFVYCFCRKQMQ